MRLGLIILGIGLVLYSGIAGFLVEVPNLPVVRESIRNMFFHVPMWFTMLGLLFYSAVQAIIFLKKEKMEADLVSANAAFVGCFFGMLGLLTGMIWARFTWGSWWTNDPKLNGALMGLLSYLAYFILRKSVPEAVKRAKLAAVYNVVAFAMMVVLILVIPRLVYGSLHPAGAGDENPVLGGGSLDARMRWVFYPAVIGWMIIGFWFVSLKNKKDGQQ